MRKLKYITALLLALCLFVAREHIAIAQHEHYEGDGHNHVSHTPTVRHYPPISTSQRSSGLANRIYSQHRTTRQYGWFDMDNPYVQLADYSTYHDTVHNHNHYEHHPQSSVNRILLPSQRANLNNYLGFVDYSRTGHYASTILDEHNHSGHSHTEDSHTDETQANDSYGAGAWKAIARGAISGPVEEFSHYNLDILFDKIGIARRGGTHRHFMSSGFYPSSIGIRSWLGY